MTQHVRKGEGMGGIPFSVNPFQVVNFPLSHSYCNLHPRISRSSLTSSSSTYIRIYTGKRPQWITKRQKCLSSSMFLLLMKAVTWFFNYCCDIPLLLLPFGVHWQNIGQRLSSILRKCPYHFNQLLWIMFKIYCSACILLLIVLFETFCNLDTLACLIYTRITGRETTWKWKAPKYD